MKKVSIVIVNYNGKDILRHILKSISGLNYDNYETIVLDNASTDGSQDFVKSNFKKIKLIENRENLGYSGINSAIRHCKGDYILFLNNDMELEKNSLEELVKTIESDKNCVLAAPRLVNF